MKYLFALTLFFSNLVFTEVWASNTKKADSEDRVWTFNYYEYSMLRDIQKEEFAKKLYEESKNNAVLGASLDIQSEFTVKKSLVSANQWDLVEFKINKACKEKKNLKNCQKISAVRLGVLDKYRAHK